MSEDAPAQPPTRSSLLYAMGRLTAETNQHGQQIASLATKQDSLPDAIVTRLEPRLIAIQSDLSGHGKRITALEQRQWIWMGGGIVLLLVSKAVLPSLIH